MRFIRIDESNIDLATEIEGVIFPHYGAHNNYLDSIEKRYSKSLIEGVKVPLWNNKDIHFSKQVKKQEI